jgi:hypothetical protein
MMVGWRGADFHGTTLPDVDPAKLETDFRQLGLSIATGGRLLKLLQKVQKGQLSEEQLLSMVGELAKEDDE